MIIPRPMFIHKQLICLLVIFIPFLTLGQTSQKKIKEVNLGEITIVSVDRLGNFILVTKKGVVKKYNSQGEVIATLKSKGIELIEPWYHPTIFIYDRGKQKYFTFGRNFENKKENSIEPSWAINPSLVCPSNDNKIWLLDKADASVKKVNPFNGEVLIEFAIDTTQFKSSPAFTFLREYQNMVFVLEKNSGILIFNSIGKQIKLIEKAGIENFNFFGEELYYLDGTVIKFIDLITAEFREIKVEGDNRFALVTDERIILVNRKNRVKVLEYKP